MVWVVEAGVLVMVVHLVVAVIVDNVSLGVEHLPSQIVVPHVRITQTEYRGPHRPLRGWIFFFVSALDVVIIVAPVVSRVPGG